VQNLREHLQQFLDRKHTCLPELEESPLQAVSTEERGLASALETQTSLIASPASASAASASSTEQPQSQVQPELSNGERGQEVELAGLRYAERKKKISRDKRSARYEQVLALHQAGMGQRAIARKLQMSRHVVQRFLASEAFPERAAGSGLRPKGKSKLAPYLAYLQERWNAGEQTGSHLFREIKARGYTGSESLLRRLLGEWRAQLPPTPRQGRGRKPRLAQEGAKKRRLSSRSASFLMILPPSKLSEVQQHQVEQMKHNEDLHSVSLLSQEFVTLLKERQVEALDCWLKRAKACHVTELSSFVNGIRRDYAAVEAAFRLPWTNGIVEGHVNRLKFLKRQMFGRAQLDLLRVQVLHAV
jgi:transposase